MASSRCNMNGILLAPGKAALGYGLGRGPPGLHIMTGIAPQVLGDGQREM